MIQDAHGERLIEPYEVRERIEADYYADPANFKTYQDGIKGLIDDVAEACEIHDKPYRARLMNVAWQAAQNRPTGPERELELLDVTFELSDIVLAAERNAANAARSEERIKTSRLEFPDTTGK